MNQSGKFFLGIFLTALLCGLVFYLHAGAFNGPSQSPPSGNGIIVAGASSVTFQGSLVSTSTTMDSVSSCGGGSASIVGSNGIGRVTTGSSAPTSCTVTFGTPFANKPVCVVSQESTLTATTTLESVPSKTTLVISMGASTAFQSMVIDYICIGQ